MTYISCTYHSLPAPAEGAVRVQVRTLDDRLPTGSTMRRGAGAHELPLDIGSRAREYVARFEQAGRIASQYGIRVSIAYSLDAGLADVKMDACSDTMLRNGARAFFGHVGRPPEVPLQHWDFMDETR